MPEEHRNAPERDQALFRPGGPGKKHRGRAAADLYRPPPAGAGGDPGAAAPPGKDRAQDPALETGRGPVTAPSPKGAGPWKGVKKEDGVWPSSFFRGRQSCPRGGLTR